MPNRHVNHVLSLSLTQTKPKSGQKVHFYFRSLTRKKKKLSLSFLAYTFSFSVRFCESMVIYFSAPTRKPGYMCNMHGTPADISLGCVVTNNDRKSAERKAASTKLNKSQNERGLHEYFRIRFEVHRQMVCARLYKS